MDNEQGAAKGNPSARVGAVHVTADEADGQLGASSTGPLEWRRGSWPMIAIAVLVILAMVGLLAFMLWGTFHQVATATLPLHH
ncbi:MAG TPA: hypothetical protein VIO57_03765 [Chloroflexota bacterium]